MNENVIKSLEDSLSELHKENGILLEKKDYLQVKKNASTMSKIAEALSENQITNFRLNPTR